ncbi:MAG: amidohydrolase family protein [Eubacteriales bacterium]|nr:amidohydrolase family protein [Eubacteriales bacterium]
MSKIIDAHLHFPNDKQLPTLIAQLNQNNIEKCVLILNTKDDQDIFLSQFAYFLEHKHRFGIALGFHYKEKYHLECAKMLEQNNIPYAIKLHSRLMQYIKQDIPAILQMIHTNKAQNIIVDGFAYGHHLEYLIGLELLIALANEFPCKNIIYAHSGGIDILKTMLLTRTLSNVRYDLSLTVPYLFRTSVYADILQFIKYNHSKIMFGSDSPDFTIEFALEKFAKVFDALQLNKETKKAILYQNALSIYKEIF